jgi:hypothetical protein
MARLHGLERNEALHRRAAWERPVTLRLAAAADRAALDRLAQRDCRPLPPGPHLVAQREGRIEAAVSLASGELVADPFRRTAELCELLRCHAGGLRVSAEHTPAATIRPRPELVPA